MKQIKRLFFFLLFISTSYAVSLAQENLSFFLHTIEKGQSLYSIAKMYQVTTSDIIRLNPGCEEKIYAGQTIKIPKGLGGAKGPTFHTIQAGETLYKLTVHYQVSAKAICEANPGLSAENFRIGQVILIPDMNVPTEPAESQPAVQQSIQGPVVPKCKEMHKVKRKETIFSVSHLYGISEQELIEANPELKKGMKKGQWLCIPYPKATVQQPVIPAEGNQPAPSNRELFDKNKEKGKAISTIQAALILPFHEDRRMVEYYEGFLMAVDSLKRKGTSLDLYVYDSGRELATLNRVLAQNEMKKMDVIFGPVYPNQIKPLSDFAKKNDIRLVIPFSKQGEEVFSNPQVYQINTPQSYLYSEVYEHFTRQFPNAHVIFIEPAVVDKDKADFIKGMKQELRLKGISTDVVSESAPKEVMAQKLRSGKTNIFVPTSSRNVLLIRALPQLILLVRENPEQEVHLFGYPEWQTYTKDHLESFFELDTYFYSSFYTNTLFPAAVRFTNSYHKWYSKDLVSEWPNYAMLGFDTGFFFLQGLTRFGSNLEDNLNKMNLTPIQTGFKFQRVNNWGGFVNKKVFFIRFAKNYELIKLDFE